jgi:hemerythrin-like domain-containing protein
MSGRRDAIGLLEADHRRMENLLKRGEQTTTRAVGKRRQLLETIAKELAIHEMLEERVFYPALEPHPEARDKVLEGFEEHHAADLVIKELQRMSVDGERWAATLKVLQEMIEHHIREEEHTMFRVARAVLGADALRALARQMTAMKAPYVSSHRTPRSRRTRPRGRRLAG